GRDGELGGMGEVLAVELDRRADADGVGAADRRERSLVDAAEPWDDRSVVEADDELRLHAHASLDALDDPHDVGCATPWRHEVEAPGPPARRPPLGLEHERPGPVAPCRRGRAGGVERPAAMVARAE